MKKDTKKFIRLRNEMVKNQIKARGITDIDVISAMRMIPRHFFVSEALMDQAYKDFPLPIGYKQTISQPLIVAEMTRALELSKTDRVLEIGTGSGYQAAIIAAIAFKVYTIERIQALFMRTRKLFDELKYHNIVTRYSDGTLGWKEQSPFDAIIVTAGAPKIPSLLVDQLNKGGRLIIPVGDKVSQTLIKVYKDNTGVYETDLGACRFVNLIGDYGW
jgi:protein-L-isoaspartate(D-aspartate) O-methyltransferase